MNSLATEITVQPQSLDPPSPPSSPARGRRIRRDVLCLVSLAIIAGFYLVERQPWTAPPAEDAAILMRYAQHLAEGHGIVWNIGEKPVDGATDFLFMVGVAAVAQTGLAIESAARLFGFTAHLLTVLVIYLTISRWNQAYWWAGWLSGAYLALGPGQAYIVAAFGTPVFALAATVTWAGALYLIKQPQSQLGSHLFALAGLVTGLIRPEGVLLASFMLLAIVFFKGIRESQQIIRSFLLVFLLIGGAYFLWRWQYFGYPLPNPFYKKGGGSLYWPSLRFSLAVTVYMAWPFLLILLAGLISRRTIKLAIFSLLPVGGFTLIWILLSNEMNYLYRFQYPNLPIILLAWPVLLESLQQAWQLPRFGQLTRWQRLAVTTLALALSLTVLQYVVRVYGSFPPPRDLSSEIGRFLRGYHQRGYLLATTEAGLIPFYARWRALDTWGLNDQWIAHNGGITPAYLAQHRPQVILVHVAQIPSGPTQREHAAWVAMVETLQKYARQNNYYLATAYGASPQNTFSYYVRTDFPASAEIIHGLQEIVTTAIKSGYAATDFAPQQRMAPTY